LYSLWGHHLASTSHEKPKIPMKWSQLEPN
jgi:hypothetical protein